MDQHSTPERDRHVTPELPAPVSVRGWLAQNGFTLAVMALLAGLMAYKEFDFLVVGKVALGLGLVIFIHELGHFVAAKWCDVHVETFSIGFGPPLPGCHFRYGETAYMLALIPLGGYVKMVGEGSDGEEGEDDPRSFKNKTVGQRMLIISAGVIMNVLLAAACFVGIYMTTGVDRPSGVVGLVESGSTSWQQGIHTGVVLKQIGDTQDPYFDDVMPEVMHWPSGQALPVVFESFENGVAKTRRAEVLPRKNETTGRPMIGIAHATTTVVIPKMRRDIPPVLPDSAAARAEPAFEHGDRIVGTTDPADPTKTKALPIDPRNPDSGNCDYVELLRRMHQLAGKDMTFLVRRAGHSAGAAPVPIKVPPAFHVAYGLRMIMGPVIAVRDQSSAAKAGVRAKAGAEPGDVLTGVEVAGDGGRVIRFSPSHPAKPEANVEQRWLDPVRLPFELDRWADSRPTGAKTVKLTFLRQKDHQENSSVSMTVDWDDSWQTSKSAPINLGSPMAIDGLGLAYSVTTFIDDIVPDSPASRLGLKREDKVKAIQYFKKTPGGKVEGEWFDLEVDQWAFAHYFAQKFEPRKIGLRVERDKQTFEVVCDGEEDRSWPVTERGVLLESDNRLQKAENLAEALAMGGRRTTRLISQIYQNLRAMVDGRISFAKNASGPLTIAAVSYDIAGESLAKFILFLGMISVNLAVINFLPIPVLDGGHMVFLIYEKIRGRPAPEQFRFAATFLGLALIGSLMLFVIYLDVKRQFLGRLF